MKSHAPRILAVWLALTVLGCLAACPETSAPPSATCASAGERCKLGDGALGVCSFADDQTLHCMSQH